MSAEQSKRSFAEEVVGQMAFISPEELLNIVRNPQSDEEICIAEFNGSEGDEYLKYLLTKDKTGHKHIFLWSSEQGQHLVVYTNALRQGGIVVSAGFVTTAIDPDSGITIRFCGTGESIDKNRVEAGEVPSRTLIGTTEGHKQAATVFWDVLEASGNTSGVTIDNLLEVPEPPQPVDSARA